MDLLISMAMDGAPVRAFFKKNIIKVYCIDRKTEMKVLLELLAELQRAKRASGAPWVRNFGKPSSQENLVVT